MRHRQTERRLRAEEAGQKKKPAAQATVSTREDTPDRQLHRKKQRSALQPITDTVLNAAPPHSQQDCTKLAVNAAADSQKLCKGSSSMYTLAQSVNATPFIPSSKNTAGHTPVNTFMDLGTTPELGRAMAQRIPAIGTPMTTDLRSNKCGNVPASVEPPSRASGPFQSPLTVQPLSDASTAQNWTSVQSGRSVPTKSTASMPSNTSDMGTLPAASMSSSGVGAAVTDTATVRATSVTASVHAHMASALAATNARFPTAPYAHASLSHARELASALRARRRRKAMSPRAQAASTFPTSCAGKASGVDPISGMASEMHVSSNEGVMPPLLCTPFTLADALAASSRGPRSSRIFKMEVL